MTSYKRAAVKVACVRHLHGRARVVGAFLLVDGWLKPYAETPEGSSDAWPFRSFKSNVIANNMLLNRAERI